MKNNFFTNDHSDKAISKACENFHFVVLYFRADQHKPCSIVDEILFKIAEERKFLAIFKIEAEKYIDISKSYKISSVPTIVFLKKGKILETLANANIEQINSTFDKYFTLHKNSNLIDENIPPYLSATNANDKTSKVSESNKQKDLSSKLFNLINSSPVMLFMKGTPVNPRCGFSKQIVEILKQNNVEYGSFDILTDENVRQGLKSYSSQKTYPQLYVSGKLIGGLDIVKELIENEEFDDLLPTQNNEKSIKARLKSLINQKKIMLFMKGSPEQPFCGFSKSMIELLNNHPQFQLHKAKNLFGYFDILTDESVRQGLKEYSNQKTYPQLYIKGKLIGGLDVVREMISDDEFDDLLLD